MRQRTCHIEVRGTGAASDSQISSESDTVVSMSARRDDIGKMERGLC